MTIAGISCVASGSNLWAWISGVGVERLIDKGGTLMIISYQENDGFVCVDLATDSAYGECLCRNSLGNIEAWYF